MAGIPELLGQKCPRLRNIFLRPSYGRPLAQARDRTNGSRQG